MTWLKQFPDFVDMPVLPAGFFDTSSRNNNCPSFTSDTHELTLWIDYQNPDRRSNCYSKRFSLESQRDGIKDGRFHFESDDWTETLLAILKFHNRRI